jgi:hypothetical protein
MLHLYVSPMDAVVVDVSEDGRIRLEHEAWSMPTLQERRAVIYAARDAVERLTELIETLERTSPIMPGRE